MIKKLFFCLVLLRCIVNAYEVESFKYTHVTNLYNSLSIIEANISEKKNNKDVAINSAIPLPKSYLVLFDFSTKEEITRLLIDAHELKQKYKLHYEDYDKFEKTFWQYIQILKIRKLESEDTEKKNTNLILK